MAEAQTRETERPEPPRIDEADRLKLHNLILQRQVFEERLNGLILWLGQNPGSLMIYDGTADQTRVTIDPAGRVGIGTATPEETYPYSCSYSCTYPCSCSSTYPCSFSTVWLYSP